MLSDQVNPDGIPWDTGFHLAHDYTIDLVEALSKQGLEVEHYYPELGPGQQEVSIRHAAALAVAGNHVLPRETARAVAIRQGLRASFAPKPLPDQPGNGAHRHARFYSPDSRLITRRPSPLSPA